MRYLGRLTRCRILTVVTILLLIVLMVVFNMGNEGRLLLSQTEVCDSAFGKTREDDIAKIKSYTFPDAAPYMEELFSTNEITESIDQTKPLIPTLVSGASGNHFSEVSRLIDNINTMVRPTYKDIKFYLFDLGLSLSQKKQLLPHCKCEIIEFPFFKYPDHVRFLKGYAWKPIAIQLILKYHPFVLWMDASIRFTTNDLDFLWKNSQHYGILMPVGFGPIAARTMSTTFQFLNEDPCLYKDINENEANFIAVYGSDLIRENFMKPWVSCALSLGCMVPDMTPERYLSCDDPDSTLYYFECHRFDQSVMSILMARLFRDNMHQHLMTYSFYKICKGGDDSRFLPMFLNTIIFDLRNECY